MEIVIDRRRFEPEGDQSRALQGLELRPEDDEPVPFVQVKRFLAHPVAGQQKSLFALVPERESEHAPKMLDTVVSMLLVEVENHLAIAARLEDVPSVTQLIAQLHVVVDLAVRDEDQRVVLVGQRLRTGREVDDAQPPYRQCDALAGELAGAVRAAVNQCPAHASELVEMPRMQRLA